MVGGWGGEAIRGQGGPCPPPSRPRGRAAGTGRAWGEHAVPSGGEKRDGGALAQMAFSEVRPGLTRSSSPAGPRGHGRPRQRPLGHYKAGRGVANAPRGSTRAAPEGSPPPKSSAPGVRHPRPATTPRRSPGQNASSGPPRAPRTPPPPPPPLPRAPAEPSDWLPGAAGLPALPSDWTATEEPARSRAPLAETSAQGGGEELN